MMINFVNAQTRPTMPSPQWLWHPARQSEHTRCSQ